MNVKSILVFLSCISNFTNLHFIWNVILDQPTVLDRISDLTLDSHKSGKLVCHVDGFPYPTVKFLKDSRPLAGSSRLRVDYEPPDTWTLTLDKAITTDSGVYTCLAENMAGKATCSAKVTIEGTTLLGLYSNTHLYIWVCLFLGYVFIASLDIRQKLDRFIMR